MTSPVEDIRRLTNQHVRVRSLLMMLPLLLLSGSMALVSAGFVSESMGLGVAVATIGAVAVAVFRFRQTFGVVVPAPPPPSRHIVRDGLIGLLAVAVIVALPTVVWVNGVGLGLRDLAFIMGAAGVILAGVTQARSWYWAIPGLTLGVLIAALIFRVSGLTAASLYLLVAATIVGAVALEYRDFSRRLPDGR